LIDRDAIETKPIEKPSGALNDHFLSPLAMTSCVRHKFLPRIQYRRTSSLDSVKYDLEHI